MFKQQIMLKVILIVSLCFLLNTYSKRYPKHNYHPKLETSCYPDEVQMPTGDNKGSCVKCKQYSIYLQTCSVNKSWNNTIDILMLLSYQGQSNSDCNQDNGYKIDNQLCILDYYISPYATIDSCLSHSAIIPNDCYNCYNSTSCISCHPGYYMILNGANKVCQPINTMINQNCLLGTNFVPNQCNWCSNGYYLQTNFNPCQRCPVTDGCSLCNDYNSKCIECLPGWDFSLTPQGCTNRITGCQPQQYPNCTLCTTKQIDGIGPSVTQCFLCDSDSPYLLKDKSNCTSTCKYVHPNCVFDMCYVSVNDYKTKCRKCQVGFYVDFDGNCQTCSKYKLFCTQCKTSNQCTRCELSYFTLSGGCGGCRSSLNDCLICSNASQCTLCKSQFYIQGSICASCSGLFPGCKQCAMDGSVCFLCMAGYFKANSTACTMCPTHCSSCSDANTCLSCIQSNPPLVDYYIDLTCKLCADIITDCLTCNDQQSNPICVQCQPDKVLIYDRLNKKGRCGNCSQIHPNCTHCIDLNQCIQCDQSSQMYVDWQLNTCLKCILPCKTCTKKYQCITCVDLALIPNSDGVCQGCNDTISNCIQCQVISATQFKCIKCQDKYRLNYTQTNVNLMCILCGLYDYVQVTPLSSTGVASPPTTSCVACSSQCKTCLSPTSCLSCLHPYESRIFQNKSIQCFDKCGDSILVQLQCDLPLGNKHDGCTNNCKIQSNFVCYYTYSNNGSQVINKLTVLNDIQSQSDRLSQIHVTSVCSYNGSIQMKVKTIKKQKYQNKLQIIITLQPYLYVYQLLNPQQISTMFTLSHLNSTINPQIYTIELNHQQSTVTFTFIQDKAYIYPITIKLSHQSVVLNSKKQFTLTTDSKLTFNTQDQKLIKAFFYPQEQLQIWSNIQTLLQVASCASIVGAAVSFGLKNTAGLQLIWILQSMYISLSWYEKPLSLPFYSLSGLSMSSGYNYPVQIKRQYQQSLGTTRLLYETTSNSGSLNTIFITQQYSVLIFPIIYLLAYVARLFEQFSNPKLVVWGRFFNNLLLYDTLLLVTLILILNLVSQAFALCFNSSIIENQSFFWATLLTAFGLLCSFCVIVRWIITPNPRYSKIIPQNVPYSIFMDLFNKYNFPVLKKKVLTLYIVIMLLSSISCVFGAFYPLMPFLLYIFLAFLIQIYKPYTRSLANYRAFFFSLVIAFGYLIRVVYLFSYEEDSTSISGIKQSSIWVLYIWIFLVIVAFILVIVDLILEKRQQIVDKKKFQQQFKQKIKQELKDTQRKIINKQTYYSHKNQIQNLLYSHYYHHQKKPILDNENDDNSQQAYLKYQQALNQMKPKPIQKNQIQYSSNFNKKTKINKYDQIDIRDKQTMGNQAWIKKNNKIKAKQKFNKEKTHLKMSYELVIKLMDQKQKLSQQNIAYRQNIQPHRFNLIQKLVQKQKQDQINKALKQKQIKLEQALYFNERHQDLIEFQAVNACKKIAAEQRTFEKDNFPQVEIYYKKLKKLTPQQIQVKKNNKKQVKNNRNQMQNISQDKQKLNMIRERLKKQQFNDQNERKDQ